MTVLEHRSSLEALGQAEGASQHDKLCRGLSQAQLPPSLAGEHRPGWGVCRPCGLQETFDWSGRGAVQARPASCPDALRLFLVAGPWDIAAQSSRARLEASVFFLGKMAH